MNKDMLFQRVDEQKDELIQMADWIFDHPECDGEEYEASKLITEYLEKYGFEVEMGVGGFPTAFRATFSHGEGGPVIGILTEYDALIGMGHGCGHHMQGPACIGAAVALSKQETEKPFQIVVYGTPAEETKGSKRDMLKNGCFKDIDVALMMHGGPNTCTDIKCLAQFSFEVTFNGVGAHAAVAPEKGRSAFDAMLIAFNGIEFLREHVSDDVRMHYTMKELTGPANIVPKRAVAEFSLRSFSRKNLEEVKERFYKIIEGASLIADVSYEIKQGTEFYNKIPVLGLNELLMENAEKAGAVQLAPPREKTGSTDFGNVMYEVPGSCIRVAFVPEGTPSHSQGFLDAGKTQAAHDAVIVGAKAIAGASMDIVETEGLLEKIQEEFRENKKKFQ